MPIAANPSVQAGHPGEVVAGKIVDHFQVGAERDARKQAFEEIVAQQRVVRHPAVQRSFKGVDIVDAFADVAAFAEQILIHIRYGGGVRIETDMPGKHE